MSDPYYQDEWVTLYEGDYRDHLDVLADELPAAIVTDPPYGETSLLWDRWVDGWLVDAAAIASSLWCFGSFRMFHEHAREFSLWKLAQDTVWEKHNGSGFAVDRFKRVHEHAVQWYRGDWKDVYNETPRTPDAVKKTVRRKERPPHMGDIEESRFTSVDGGDRLMRSVVRLRSMHGRAINETQKPVQLVGLFVECSTPPRWIGRRPVRRLVHDGSSCPPVGSPRGSVRDAAEAMRVSCSPPRARDCRPVVDGRRRMSEQIRDVPLNDETRSKLAELLLDAYDAGMLKVSHTRDGETWLVDSGDTYIVAFPAGSVPWRWGA